MKNNQTTFIIIAIIAIAIVIIIWLSKKEVIAQDPVDPDIHPRIQESDFIENYKGYDIYFWGGRPNPYWIQSPTIIQWFLTVEQARNRINNIVG